MNEICFTLPALLSPAECTELIERGERSRYQPTGSDYPESYRNNDRLLLDSPTLAEILGSRLADRLPAQIVAKGVRWTLVGLNPRFRGCRYSGGQSFRRHRDGAYSPNPGCQSMLTVMLYLNDQNEFEGGSTRFYADRFTEELDFEVAPQQGQAIIFSHSYWHDGEAVTQGTKYVLRTDVLYRTTAEVEEGHRGYVWDILQLRNGLLATGSRDKTIRIWDQRRTVQTLNAHEASVTALAEVDGTLFSGSRDRSIIAWDPDGTAARRWTAHEGAILALRSLEDGTFLSSGADGRVRRWNGFGEQLGQVEVGSWPWALLKLEDGGLLIGTESGEIWGASRELSALELLGVLECPLLSAVRDDRGTVYLGGGDGKLRVCHGGTFFGHETWSGHRGPVTSLVVLSDQTLVSGAEDDGVRVWRDGLSIELTRHDDFVRALCATSDDRIVSVSYDGSLQWSNPSAILRTEREAKPAGAISGTAAAIW